MSTKLLFISYICFMITYSIYGLVDPRTNKVFYIGETTQLLKRYRSHLLDVKNGAKQNGIKKKYFAELKELGVKPFLKVFEIDIESKELAVEREGFYIQLYKSNGCDLINMNDGGNKPPSKKGVKVYHGRKIFESSPLKKEVFQYDKQFNLVASYRGVREASRITGIDHRSIAQVANGSYIHRKTAGKYYWRYDKI